MGKLPCLELGDDPFERGVVHGRAMAGPIRDNIQTYLDRFSVGGVTPERARKLGREWAPKIGDYDARYHDEMRGIAEGAGLDLGEIAMLNARYEITYSVFSSEATPATIIPEPDGCTSFGLLAEATSDGSTIIGENWDWLAGIEGRTLVTRVRRNDAPDLVCFTEAGIVGGKMGVNEVGIGLVVNGLVTPEDGKYPFEKPFHVRCREILSAATFDKALLPIVSTNRVCSTNFLIGQAGGEIIDIEVSPDRAGYLYPVDGLITHANHFTSSIPVESRMERLSANTLFRAARLDRLLRPHIGAIDHTLLKRTLTDHFSKPGSLCRHADTTLPEAKRVITVASMIIDLDQRVLYATSGQPCKTEYEPFPLYD